PGWIDGGDAINRIEGDRHHQINADHEWDAQPDQAVGEESLPALALQARPDKQAGQKKHELHQIEKMKGEKKIEAEPTLVIDNRENPPIVGRQVEGWRCRGLRDDMGGKRMEGDDEEQQNAPQILERQAGFRHFPNTPEQAVRAADGDDNTTCRKNVDTAAFVHTPGNSFMMNS